MIYGIISHIMITFCALSVLIIHTFPRKRPDYNLLLFLHFFCAFMALEQLQYIDEIKIFAKIQKTRPLKRSSEN